MAAEEEPGAVAELVLDGQEVLLCVRTEVGGFREEMAEHLGYDKHDPCRSTAVPRSAARSAPRSIPFARA